MKTNNKKTMFKRMAANSQAKQLRDARAGKFTSVDPLSLSQGSVNLFSEEMFAKGEINYALTLIAFMITMPPSFRRGRKLTKAEIEEAKKRAELDKKIAEWYNDPKHPYKGD